MRTRLVAGFCLAIVTLALLNARQPAPAPGILALVVEVQPAAVRVLSVRAVRGVIREQNPRELANVPHGSTDLLVEYALKPADKSAPPLATGVFHVSFVGVREDGPGPDPAPPTGATYRAKKRVVPLYVPDVRAFSIAFAALTPVDGVPPDKWGRTPIGEVSMPAVRR